MGFFSRLLGVDPPLAPAPVPLRVPLVWDTRTQALNGISLGCGMEALTPLGPCPDVRYLGRHSTHCAYPHLGVLLEFGGSGTLDFITIVISDDGCNPLGYGSAMAALHVQPAGVTLTPSITAAEMTRLFGPFELMEKDEDELVGIFRSGGICYEATFDAEARLVSVVVRRETLGKL